MFLIIKMVKSSKNPAFLPPNHTHQPISNHMTRPLFALLVFMLALSACFEPKEGCLDIAATNFDAGADKDCCCEYPKLQLTVNQQYDTLLFRNDSLYAQSDGYLFRIKSVSFYLSDFQLFQGGNVFTVSDTIRLNTFQGNDTSSQVFTNDFQLVRRTPVIYSLGTFRQDGVFEQVNFRLGLSPEAQKVVPSKAPAAHPLFTQADSLWLDPSEGFVFLQAVIVRDSMGATLPDTLRFSQADLGFLVLSKPGSFVHPTGYDFPLVLTVDYKKMFEGVNWSQHDISTWKTKIVANLPNTFSVSQ